MNRRYGWLALVGLLALACEQVDQSGANDPLRARHAIGASGGSIAISGAVLVVPPGALDDTATLTVTVTEEDPLGDFVRLTPVYRFAPEGKRFDVPVRIALRYDGDVAAPAVWWSDGEAFVRLGGEVGGGGVSVEVDHFGAAFVGTPADPVR